METLVTAATLLQTDGDVVPVELQEVVDPLLLVGRFVVGFGVVLLAGWVVLGPAVSRVVERRNPNNPTLVEAISRYVRLLFVGCALFVGFGAAGFTGVVGNSALVIAAGTLALGVAGQRVIGSLVSGVALVTDPEFNIGNYIQWDGGEGEVTSITLRVTRVQTPDGGLVTIPNTILTDGSIVRPYQQGCCRTAEHISVAYDSDIETALSVLADTAGATDGIRDEPEPTVEVDELGDDGVILCARYWVEDPRRNLAHVQSVFTRSVKDRLEGANVEINPASKRDLEGRIQVGESVS